MADAKRATEFTFAFSLIDESTGGFALDPEISAGDFTVSQDGSTFVATTNLPVVQPASGMTLYITLTAAEMDGDIIVVYGNDPDGAWQEVEVVIITSSSLADNLDVDGYDLEQILKGIAAATMGVDSTPTADGPQYQAVDGSKTRITATEDRVTVTLDLD